MSAAVNPSPRLRGEVGRMGWQANAGRWGEIDTVSLSYPNTPFPSAALRVLPPINGEEDHG